MHFACMPPQSELYTYIYMYICVQCSDKNLLWNRQTNNGNCLALLGALRWSDACQWPVSCSFGSVLQLLYCSSLFSSHLATLKKLLRKLKLTVRLSTTTVGNTEHRRAPKTAVCQVQNSSIAWRLLQGCLVRSGRIPHVSSMSSLSSPGARKPDSPKAIWGRRR